MKACVTATLNTPARTRKVHSAAWSLELELYTYTYSRERERKRERQVHWRSDDAKRGRQGLRLRGRTNYVANVNSKKQQTASANGKMQ